jgi:uncharacterized membrane protein YdjX (TVP38/TMEM64 family)
MQEGQSPPLTRTKDGRVENEEKNHGTTAPDTAPSAAPAVINPFDYDVQSASLSSSGTPSIKNHPFVSMIDSEVQGGAKRPIEMEDDFGFQNEPDQQQRMLGQETEIQSDQFHDDCNKQSEKEENRITASSTTVERWDEHDGVTDEDSNGGSDGENNSHDENNNNSSSSSSGHSPTTTISSRLGFCSYWLRRLIFRVCRPHVQTPCCCLSSPHIQCLKQISPRKRQIICRSLIIIFMIITITFTLLDLIFLKRYLYSWLQSLLEFLEENPGGGAVIFVGIFVIASLCFFPVPLLSMGAGFVYIELYGLGIGICVSFLVCYIGYLCGAAICFARSRYLMRRLVVRFSEKYPVVRAVDRAFETMGFRIFLLLRLSPAMPFNALNYIGGITAIKFKSYWLSTCVGIIPGLIWTVFVGATFGTVGRKGVDGNQQLDEKSAVNKGIVLGLGIGLGVMGLIGTAIYSRIELTKIIIAEQQEREREEQAGLRYSNSTLDEAAENPQSGCDDDIISLTTDEESSIAVRSRKGSFHSITPSLSLDDERLFPTITTPARRRNWTADDIAAELPIVPVVTPFFRRMMSPSENPRDDQIGDSRRTGGAGASPLNKTQGLREIDESCALSFRNQQGQDGFLRDDYKPVSNRRRCGTDPNTYAMPSRKQVEILNNIAMEEKTGGVEAAPKKGLIKLFQGLTIPSSNDFPRFNRRRCNSDPDEAEKRAAAIDAAGLDIEAGLENHRRSSNRDMLHSFHVADRDAFEPAIPQLRRSASSRES